MEGNRQERRNKKLQQLNGNGPQVDLTVPKQLIEFARMIFLQKMASPRSWWARVFKIKNREVMVKESFKDALAFENYSNHYIQANADRQMKKIADAEAISPNEVVNPETVNSETVDKDQ